MSSSGAPKCSVSDCNNLQDRSLKWKRSVELLNALQAAPRRGWPPTAGICNSHAKQARHRTNPDAAAAKLQIARESTFNKSEVVSQFSGLFEKNESTPLRLGRDDCVSGVDFV